MIVIALTTQSCPSSSLPGSIRGKHGNLCSELSLMMFNFFFSFFYANNSLRSRHILHGPVQMIKHEQALRFQALKQAGFSTLKQLGCIFTIPHAVFFPVKRRFESRTRRSIYRLLLNSVLLLLVGAPDSWSKGCEFESWQERWENFLFQSYLCVLTLIWCLFHPPVTAVAW